MRMQPISGRKLCLYAGTLLSSIVIGWIGTALMNDFTGAVGTILRLIAIALPIRLVVQEIRQHGKAQTPQANPAVVEPSERTALQTLVRTWRNMAIASVLMGGIMCVMAMGLRWYAVLLLPLACLGGPLSLLCLNPDAVPRVAVCVFVYALGVAWLFWKTSVWARAVFVVLSLLWWVMGLSMASVGMDGGSSLFL